MPQLAPLPLGTANFPRLRSCGRLYVDKTELLQNLIETGDWYFLARPRRFGKSLTLSTLEAMFRGKADLFSGLAASNWVKEQSQHPATVLRLDLSGLRPYRDASELNHALSRHLIDRAQQFDLTLTEETSPTGYLIQLVQRLYEKAGPVVLLIDEYDAPILSAITSPDRAELFREVLRSLYQVLKSLEDMLRFLFITGISKLTKAGIFSALNNLYDITLASAYSTLTGYTQNELEAYFSTYIQDIQKNSPYSSEKDILYTIQKFYDGYSFDGVTRVYNPYSVLYFFREKKFSNYWYESGSTSFISYYFKKHKIDLPETYQNSRVTKEQLVSSEIEQASPEIFLWQAGYLTIAKREGDDFTLTYPNQEVLTSLSKMYLDSIYPVDEYQTIGNMLWDDIQRADIDHLCAEYNKALASIPYTDFKCANEYWYRGLFLMLLHGAGIDAFGEVPNCKGRSDLLVAGKNSVLLIEFKMARTATGIETAFREAEDQIKEKKYLAPFMNGPRALIGAVLAIDEKDRTAHGRIVHRKPAKKNASASSE